MIIIHGDNEVLSRFELTRIKQSFKGGEVVVFYGDKINLTDIIQSLESQSLFADSRLVVIEGIFSGKSKKTDIIDYLSMQSDNPQIIIFEKKKIDKRILAHFPKAVVKEYRTETVIFKFLDSLGMGSKRTSATLLKNLLAGEPAEIVLSMIVRQFRLLFLIRSGALEQDLGMAPWQFKRLSYQANRFKTENLARGLERLLNIDFMQKSGKSIYDLSFAIEIFVLNL